MYSKLSSEKIILKNNCIYCHVFIFSISFAWESRRGIMGHNTSWILFQLWVSGMLRKPSSFHQVLHVVSHCAAIGLHANIFVLPTTSHSSHSAWDIQFNLTAENICVVYYIRIKIPRDVTKSIWKSLNVKLYIWRGKFLASENHCFSLSPVEVHTWTYSNPNFIKISDHLEFTVLSEQLWS